MGAVSTSTHFVVERAVESIYLGAMDRRQVVGSTASSSTISLSAMPISPVSHNLSLISVLCDLSGSDVESTTLSPRHDLESLVVVVHHHHCCLLYYGGGCLL